MRTRKLLLVLGVAAAMLTALAGITLAQSTPTGALTHTQNLNQVSFTATWTGHNPNSWNFFEFGDGSSVYINGAETDNKVVGHAYSYRVGGLVTYPVTLTITGYDGTSATVTDTVMIDDRPTEPTSASIKIAKQELNKLMFQVDWTGASSTLAHTIDFGDGSSTERVGSSGSMTITHDFDYLPGGIITRTVTFTVRANDHASARVHTFVVIDDRPKALKPTYLPFVIR